MDYKTAARIKVNSRLQPAKDIHVAFSDLVSSTNQDDFPELRRKFILSIDSAEIDFKILQDELATMESLVNKWKDEIDQCEQQFKLLEDENLSLLLEKEQIEQEKEKVDKLIQMKSQIKSEKINHKIESTKKVEKDNEQTREEIKKVEETNERRKIGLQQIVEGFEKFLLIEKQPPRESNEEDINEDEERYNEENEERFNEERYNEENEERYNEENEERYNEENENMYHNDNDN